MHTWNGHSDWGNVLFDSSFLCAMIGLIAFMEYHVAVRCDMHGRLCARSPNKKGGINGPGRGRAPGQGHPQSAC
jgi:hypothetical protein